MDSASEIAFDRNDQNAGIIREVIEVSPDGDEHSCYEITPGARDRYNAFIEKYGKEMLPPLKKDFGIVPVKSSGNFFMTKEAAEKWRLMIIFHDKERIDHSDTIAGKIGL